MCCHVGLRWGGAAQQELTRGAGVDSDGPGGQLSRLCCSCFVFSLSVSLLLLFPLFAVLLNCPYPDPPVSACLFHCTPHRGGGRGSRVVLLLPATVEPEH